MIKNKQLIKNMAVEAKLKLALLNDFCQENKELEAMSLEAYNKVNDIEEILRNN